MENILRQHDHYIHFERDFERLSRTSWRAFISRLVESRKIRLDSVSNLRNTSVHANGHVWWITWRSLESCQLQDHLLSFAICDAKVAKGYRGSPGSDTKCDNGIPDDINHWVMIPLSFRFKCIARKDNTMRLPLCGFKLQKAVYDPYFMILKVYNTQ